MDVFIVIAIQAIGAHTLRDIAGVRLSADDAINAAREFWKGSSRNYALKDVIVVKFDTTEPPGLQHGVGKPVFSMADELSDGVEASSPPDCS